MNLLSVFTGFIYRSDWTDISEEVTRFFNDFVNNNATYTLVKTLVLKKYWVELDCKAQDIISLTYFMLIDNCLRTYTTLDEINMHCTAGPCGFYRFLTGFDNFQKFFTSNKSDEREKYRTLCDAHISKNNMPFVLHIPIKSVFNNIENPEYKLI